MNSHPTGDQPQQGEVQQEYLPPAWRAETGSASYTSISARPRWASVRYPGEGPTASRHQEAAGERLMPRSRSRVSGANECPHRPIDRNREQSAQLLVQPQIHVVAIGLRGSNEIGICVVFGGIGFYWPGGQRILPRTRSSRRRSRARGSRRLFKAGLAEFFSGMSPHCRSGDRSPRYYCRSALTRVIA